MEEEEEEGNNKERKRTSLRKTPTSRSSYYGPVRRIIDRTVSPVRRSNLELSLSPFHPPIARPDKVTEWRDTNFLGCKTGTEGDNTGVRFIIGAMHFVL